MTNKKQKILLNATVLILSGLLLHAQPAHSEPVALDDRTMDTVMAGSAAEGGGIVVGQNSEAIVNRTTELDLSGEAQQNANGLNIVNSTESAVANVVNIWDGSGVTATKEDNDTNSEVKINQINNITQEQVNSATISGYVRSESDHTETLNRSVSAGYESKIVDYHSVTNHIEETRTSEAKSFANVDTGISFNVNKKQLDFTGHLGQGVAVSGYTHTKLGAGSADIGLAVNGNITAYSGDGKLVNPDTDDELRTFLEATGTGTLNLEMVTLFRLPTFDIKISGVGCGVAFGSCKADSTFNETVETNTDNHTLDIFEDHQSGQGSFSEVQTSVYRSPFELKSARAEYIVIDDSTLELNSDVTLELSESAQKDIKGMNIVNTIGSNVANSTNVARTTSFEARKATLVLNQFNTVNHGH